MQEQTGFDEHTRVPTLFQLDCILVVSIFGDKHDTKKRFTTCFSYPSIELITSLSGSTMEDEEECNDDNDDLGGVGGDVDDNMMDSLFKLSAYVSDNDNDKEDESDADNEDFPTLLPRRNGSDASHGWTYLTGDALAPDVAISIDGVDHRLLARARKEVPAVLDKIKRKLFGKRHRDMSKVLPGDFLKAFMDPHLLGYMKAFINNNMSSSNPVTSAEILAFIGVEFMLLFYKVRGSHHAITTLNLSLLLSCCSTSF